MNKDEKKKITITGAGGFLGSNLADALAGRAGCTVYALSSRAEQLQWAGTSENIKYCSKNIIFSNEAEKVLHDAVVVNCAFPRNTSGTEMADGLRYIQRLFCSAEEFGAKAVINISSQSVYSQGRQELATEDTRVSLESAYAVGKYATELMLECACKKAEIPYTNLRMASLVGPGFNQRIVNRFVKRAIAGETLQVVKSAQKFGFLDIEDAVRALLAVLDTEPEQWKPIYNVGNGKEYDVEYIAQRVISVLKRNGLHIPDICIENGNATGRTGVAFAQLHTDTGFRAVVDLDSSIQRILEQIQRENGD